MSGPDENGIITGVPVEGGRPSAPPPGGPAGPVVGAVVTGGGGPVPGRRPGRRGRLVLAAVLAVPVLELAGMVVVARALGGLALVGLLVAAWLVGMAVLRRARAGAVRRLERAARAEATAEDAAGPTTTALLVLAGVLLVVPGFLSDVVGLVLLVPGVRRLVAARVGEALLGRLNARAVRIVPGSVVGDPRPRP